jgi:putative SOS response-associated peptidase YedK
MCSRFALRGPVSALESAFALPLHGPFADRLDITPGSPILTVRVGAYSAAAPAEFAYVRWGFVAGWQKDEQELHSLHLARAETVLEKPSFKHAFGRRRCIVPASAYFDSITVRNASQPNKVPCLISPATTGLLAFAGIWEVWQGASGSEVESAALLTKPADASLAGRFKRMPVCLPASAWKAWLSPETDLAEAHGLLQLTTALEVHSA